MKAFFILFLFFLKLMTLSNEDSQNSVRAPTNLSLSHLPSSPESRRKVANEVFYHAVRLSFGGEIE